MYAETGEIALRNPSILNIKAEVHTILSPFFCQLILQRCVFEHSWYFKKNCTGSGDFDRNKDADTFVELIAYIRFVLSEEMNYSRSTTILENTGADDI